MSSYDANKGWQQVFKPQEPAKNDGGLEPLRRAQPTEPAKPFVTGYEKTQLTGHGEFRPKKVEDTQKKT